jgi:zinc protease
MERRRVVFVMAVVLSAAWFMTRVESLVKVKESDNVTVKETNQGQLDMQKVKTETNHVIKKNDYVQKKILSNGMTVLVRPMHNIPKVSLQIWYNVGSKDEKSGERGVAHLIEHMIFKGTQKLSEGDLNAIAHKLSGSINAFTSWDYTGYQFDFPTQHWKETLPIMADCMRNAAFRDEPLNSEMKTVIQELKMYRDSYVRTLIDDLMGAVFVEHPYHYPVIGFKQDLWHFYGDDLRAFYHKHYWPNNATLVVVGDVDSEEVYALAEKQFGSIPANPDYKKDHYYMNRDISAKSVTLYRDVTQPIVILAFVLPGIKTRNEHILEVTSWVLGAGKSSRLQQKLVDELQLATSLETSYFDLFEHALFFVIFEPRDIKDLASIEQIIAQEIEAAIAGISEHEITRAIRQAQMRLYSILEDSEKQAYEIGKAFLATGDENYLFHYLSDSPEKIREQVTYLLKSYFRPVVMHKGLVLPLPESEKVEWLKLQQAADEEDARILAARARKTPLEKLSPASNVPVHEPVAFNFAKAQSCVLSNGVKVFYHDNNNTPKINLILELKAKSYYDPEDMQGIYNFMAKMLTEGTERYSAAEFADAVESRGMSLSVSPGYISLSLMRDDLEVGLDLLQEVLCRAVFDKKKIEKVRAQILVDIKNYWDDPSTFAGQLIREKIYKGHPYSKNEIGTKESVKKINQKDIIDFYKKYISPNGAKLSIVGDLGGNDLKKVLEQKLGSWQGPVVEPIEFPLLAAATHEVIDYPINRDQVVLCYAGLSIDRKNPSFDKCLLFDQIFGAGVLGSMHSRLYELRERSGLFYNINGSLLAKTGEQPGLAIVKTIVSLDNLKEAQEEIEKTIATVADSIRPQEVAEARLAVVNSLANNFESNHAIAGVFLFLDKYGFPADFYDHRADDLAKVKLADMQQTAKKILDLNKMITLRIGRLHNDKSEDKAS